MVTFGIILYFSVGIAALSVFEILTGRIRKKITMSAAESQNRMMQSGNFVGIKTTTVLLLLAVWLFWPMIFVGAAQSKLQKRRTDEK